MVICIDNTYIQTDQVRVEGADVESVPESGCGRGGIHSSEDGSEVCTIVGGPA